MIVLGGTYRETIIFPKRQSHLVGSGLRSALALSESRPTLLTASSVEEASELTEIANAAGIPIRRVDRDRSVEFRYLDPLLTPSLLGTGARTERQLVVTSPDDVLVFGMVEANGYDTVTARSVVVDPQSPKAASTDILRAIDSARVALSANWREIERLTGIHNPIDAAKAALSLDANLVAVVVKCGALGYVSANPSGAQWEHALPTLRVRPIGSGDVFSSMFAHAWFAGADVHSAATQAARATAWWTLDGGDTLPLALLGDGSAIASIDALQSPPLHPGYRPKIYLAGPFFTLSERWLVEQARMSLLGLGARVFSPIHEIGPGGFEVAAHDLAGLETCDVVLALLDGHDPGTIYELGWAARHGIPIVGFSSEPHLKEFKMLIGMGAEIHTDLSTATYRAIWAGQGIRTMPGLHPDEGLEAEPHDA